MVFYTIINASARRSEQHEAAYKLLEKSLKIMYGISDPVIEKKENGKPFITNYPNIYFNLSHCTGLMVCGISGGEIGVDAELIRTYSGKAAKRIFSESERNFVLHGLDKEKNFFRIWTLKEALGKALGTGISSDLSRHEFAFHDGVPMCSSFHEKKFSQKILMNTWVISVCADDYENNFQRI